jgi:hypothetical protein
MDTALAMPPARPSLLVLARLYFAACQHTRSGDDAVLLTNTSIMTACCTDSALSTGPWPDVTAAWCSIDNVPNPKPEPDSREQAV